jgi:hypothetical protein
MDIGLGMRFEGDRVLDPVIAATDPLQSIEQGGGKLRPFHKRMVESFLQGVDSWPNDLKLSKMPEDLRRSTTR